MSGLPTGTVTFLFTDIEGSTALLQRLGDRRYSEVLAEHHRLLRDAFVEGNGQEIDTQGDAFLVAFSRARDAVATAAAAQQVLVKHRWPDGASLCVRMGLHTGEPLSGETGYVGIDVHRAARIANAGHGGQILLSDVTHGLVARDLPDGVSLRDLGEHRLKDLAHQHRLFQVVAAELPADFPPIRSLDALPNNLPRQLTSFIGREKEMAEVRRLLSTAYLVTLTGSGGAGKTRLALHAAADVVEDFPDGVWLAELAPIADPALVSKTVASTLNVPEQPGRDMSDTLVDALRPKALLLVLDNCEHLLMACGDLVAVLLRACPKVRILATSREGLGVPGETLWRVPSLSVPEDVRQLPPPEKLVLYDAVRLFLDRAVATAPGFTLTNETALAVAQVCQRLDGIPLAIELAAARVKVLAVEQIAARLDDRFRLLTGGSRMVLPRQQTLRAAIDWSYNLLSETERVLFRRLSVFAGGWTLEAAEAVCAGGGVEADQVLDVLTSLVDKSLALAETQRGEAPYRLLETVRQYGGDRLEESGESGDLKRRHLAWYLGVAERADPNLRGPEQEVWLERLETELDNLRASLAWGRMDAQSTEAWLRLIGGLHYFWWVGEHWNEGRRWTDEALTRGNESGPATLLRIAISAASLAYRQGDYERCGQLAEQILTLSRTLEDKEGIIWAITMSGNVALERDPAHATPLLEESLALARDLGDKWLIGFQLLQLADTARALSDYEHAITLGIESIDLCRQVGDRWRTAAGLRAMGIVSLRQREYDRAAAFYAESLPLCGRRNLWVSFQCLEGLGCVASARGQHVRAARLFGAAELLRESLRSRRDSDYQPEIDQHINATQTLLGRASFEAAWSEGRAMTLDQALEYALNVPDSGGAQGGPG